MKRLALANVSIRWKVVGVVFVVLAVSLLLAGAGLLFNARTGFERDLAQRMTVLADVIGENSVAALMFRDPQAAAETLWALHNDARIVAGAIYDTSGRRLADYRRAEAHWQVPEQAPPSSLGGPTFADDMAVLVRPIELHGTPRGMVYLAAETTGWTEALQHFLAILISLFAAVLGVGFLVSIGLQRLVTGPIHDLVSLMRRIGRTRAYELRATPRGHDEIGVLVEGFNGMLDEIAARRREAERAHEELRRRVSELDAEVAQRRQAQAELRRSEARYRTLVAATTSVVFSTDAAGRVLERLPSWEAYTGQRWDAYRGAGWAAMVHRADRRRLRAAWIRALREGEMFEVEARVWHAPSRRHRYCLMRAVAQRGADGAPYEWIGTMSDVDDRKRAAEQFRIAVEGAPNAMVMIDADGRIALMNRQLETLFGYDRDELLGQPIERLVPERMRQRHPQFRAAFFADPGARPMGAGRDLRGRHKSGREIPVEIGLNPFVTEEGTFCLASIVDITERRRAEDRLRHYTEELQRSNRELAQFAYVASHDLQEPLRAISGCVQLLAQRYRDRLDGRATELIEHTVSGAQRMQALINDLLSYSRLSTRARPFEACHLEQPLRQALANLELTLRESGAEVTVDAMPVVSADPTQLAQLFQNLIGNAVKFRAARPPRIHVGVRQRQGSRLFYVRDNGIGIEPQYIERIFGVFQRLHNRNKYPGNGIGLAICRKIVERHNGRIWVESVAGEGSTFYFTLPLGNVHNEEQFEPLGSQRR